MGEFTHAVRRPNGLGPVPPPPVVEVPVSDLYSLLLSQIRYSMGRMTYIVSECCRRVRQYWPHLERAHRSTLLRDVSEELERYEQAGKKCGMDFDHAEWEALRAWMKAQVEEA